MQCHSCDCYVRTVRQKRILKSSSPSIRRVRYRVTLALRSGLTQKRIPVRTDAPYRRSQHLRSTCCAFVCHLLQGIASGHTHLSLIVLPPSVAVRAVVAVPRCRVQPARPHHLSVTRYHLPPYLWYMFSAVVSRHHLSPSAIFCDHMFVIICRRLSLYFISCPTVILHIYFVHSSIFMLFPPW